LRINAEGAANVTSDGVAPLHQAFKANFAAIDADKDGGLSMQELGAAMKQMGAWPVSVVIVPDR